MKIFRFLLILSVILSIGYFSWDYYTGRMLREKRERATLVYEESRSGYYV